MNAENTAIQVNAGGERCIEGLESVKIVDSREILEQVIDQHVCFALSLGIGGDDDGGFLRTGIIGLSGERIGTEDIGYVVVVGVQIAMLQGGISIPINIDERAGTDLDGKVVSTGDLKPFGIENDNAQGRGISPILTGCKLILDSAGLGRG